jgi:hypothetical protein
MWQLAGAITVNTELKTYVLGMQQYTAQGCAGPLPSSFPQQNVMFGSALDYL